MQSFASTSFPSRHIFVRVPNINSPITIHLSLVKSAHVLLCYTYTSTHPQPPRLSDNINPVSIVDQKVTAFSLECQCEFPDECSTNGLWTPFRHRIILLAYKANVPHTSNFGLGEIHELNSYLMSGNLLTQQRPLRKTFFYPC